MIVPVTVDVVETLSRGLMGLLPFFPVSEPRPESFLSMSTVDHRSLVAIRTGPELPELLALLLLNCKTGLECFLMLCSHELLKLSCAVGRHFNSKFSIEVV